ncbi:MAG TPA: DNA polymerase III subunit delta [Hyphomicrobiaceae bacterium]|nr:DNA polymerase III subunit delta [Hyphomicrobiaceae bacterium]
MVAIKTHQAETFLRTLDRLPLAILLYGSDAGLVLERAAQLAQRLAAEHDPPGEILRLDDSSLEDDPNRLLVELKTVPMFSGRKILRASAGRRITAASLRPLLEEGPFEGFLIVEAGNLRPDEALRSLFEKSAAAAAIACFPDEARDLEAVARDVLGRAQLQIAPEALRLLLSRLGADRALSRAEIEKLALYASGKGKIEEADVEAAVGDAAELAIDRVVLAAGSGRLEAALNECDRCVAGGENAQAIIAALQRHFVRLHAMRGAFDGGRALEDIMRQQRPPLHFRRKAIVEQHCRTWTLAALDGALGRINAAAKAARLNSSIDATLAAKLIIDLAGMIGQQTRVGAEPNLPAPS